MLAIAFDFRSPFRQETARIERLDELLEFVVAYFVELVDARLRRGLYRDYVELEENLGIVRGRIVIGADIQRNAILRHRTYCRYSEFTRDIPENQIIRQVVHHLNGWVRGSELRLKLRQIDAVLAEVTPTNLPAAALDRMRYHRLNDDYYPIHQLCRLFLEGASVSEDEGPIDFKTFLIDMNRLFELFVTQILCDLAPRRVTIEGQARAWLDADQQIGIRPDILMRVNGSSAVVADCKYKRLPESEPVEQDLYQVLSYCVTIPAQFGILIYPKTEASPYPPVAIRNTAIQIQPVPINLDAAPEDFDGECERFADQVFSLTLAASRDPSLATG
jgi:5-methylcytosine-specific restriction enzyme subunit McrC